MSKQFVSWHKECLEAMRETFRREHEKLEALQDSVNRLAMECRFLDFQITEAKKQGKSDFDVEKFLKNKKEQFIKDEENERWHTSCDGCRWKDEDAANSWKREACGNCVRYDNFELASSLSSSRRRHK